MNATVTAEQQAQAAPLVCDSIQDRSSFGLSLFDFCFSALVLLSLSPLILLISILIKLTSKGPIFHRCSRIGLKGRVILCWKFRTMEIGAEQKLLRLINQSPQLGEEWSKFRKLHKDPRITRIGNFLRKTSLDELPQFWNVIRGEMSVVGPRPPALIGPRNQWLEETIQIYGAYAPKILSVKPGITGIWQISGRSALSLEEKIKLEADYIDKRTWLSDLTLIVKTIPVVISTKGAC